MKIPSQNLIIQLFELIIEFWIWKELINKNINIFKSLKKLGYYEKN